MCEFCKSLCPRNYKLKSPTQIYTPLEPNMPSLSVAFLNEANRVLSRETHLNTLTTCAALQMLSLSAICLGLHADSSRYFKESVKIGKRMGLFGVHSEAESANVWLADDDDWRRAASYTAWGVFNWIVYVFSKINKAVSRLLTWKKTQHTWVTLQYARG